MTQGFQFGLTDGGVELFNGVVTPGETTLAVQTAQVAQASRLTSGLNRVIPVVGSTAMLLTKNQAIGSSVTVANYAATAIALTVYPPWDDVAGAASGGKIQGGAANAAFSIPQLKSATFYALPNGIDFTVVLSA